METAVDWTPGILVAIAGLAVGLWVALRARTARAAPQVEALPLEVRDLLGKRDVLVHQLQELEDMAGKKTPAQLAQDRHALELEAARVLMQLDDRTQAASPKPRKKAAAEPPAPGPPGWLAERPALRGFLWGVGAMVMLGGLLLSVRQTATTREEGGSLTGNTPPMGRASAAPEPARETGEEARLKAAIERNPDDLDAHIALAQIHLGRQDMMGVWNETKAVLARSPGHPQALAYQALVRLAMGQGDAARSMLEKVIATSPDLIEGYLHLALVHVRMKNMAEAEAVMAKAQKRFPARAEMLKALLTEMRQQAATGPEAPDAAEADPHAGLGMPEPSAAAAVTAPPLPAPARASGNGKSVEGIVELDPSLLGKLAPGALLFITAREADASGGPPTAVKRLSATFPLRFELSAADSMMGSELPARLKIEARVDSDGDPLTRDPADPSARIDGVALGARDLRLVLRR